LFRKVGVETENVVEVEVEVAPVLIVAKVEKIIVVKMVVMHIMYLLCPVLHGHPKVKIGRVSRASGQEPRDEVSPSNTGGLHTMILLPCDMGGLW